MPDYRIACATFNGQLAAGHALDEAAEHIGAWLAPASAAGSRDEAERMDEDERGGVPDLVAVGLQEMMPLVSASTALSLQEPR